MNATSKRSLDENEKQLVEQSKNLDGLSHRELTDLAKQLRSRRERVQRLIRERNRTARKGGGANPDTGAREKKDILITAIERVNAALQDRAQTRKGATATANLKAAVKRKAKADKAVEAELKDHKTANEGPAAKPNKKNAPSGALNAEGSKPAAKRAGPR